MIGRGKVLLAICQRVEEAAMPRPTGREGHLEAEPAVRVDRPRAAWLCRHSERAHEVGIAVARTQPLLRLRPFGRDPPAPYDAVGFDLEDIGEIRAKNDLELEAHRLHAAVGDIQVLVHAAGNGAAYDQAKGARRDG